MKNTTKRIIFKIHDVPEGGPRTEQVWARVQERYTHLSSRYGVKEQLVRNKMKTKDDNNND